jgi:FMN phosphatase YigB (HAD superfamily)
MQCRLTWAILQFIPQQCVFVGDNPRRSLVGPKAVGIEAIIINRKGTIQPTKEDVNVIRALYELPDKLKHLQ